jgi:hypothetical protein
VFFCGKISPLDDQNKGVATTCIKELLGKKRLKVFIFRDPKKKG